MLQALARDAGGGAPRAAWGVPVALWWRDADEIVIDQQTQSATFFDELEKLGPRGRVEKVTGSWSHTAESYRRLQLPGAVEWLGPGGGGGSGWLVSQQTGATAPLPAD